METNRLTVLTYRDIAIYTASFRNKYINYRA
jgi:hypothetical protein